MVCVYLPYLLLPHLVQNYLLLVASYIFYGWWDWRFLSLILFSTAVNYFLALAIHKTEDTKKQYSYLIISLVISFGMLAIFKYLGFFVESAANLLEALGFNPNLPVLNIILPLGISFYTFQSTSYTIDVYRKQIPPTTNFFDFALFIAFFPQLIAGPIGKAKNLLPQIQSPRVITYEQISRGSFLILWGLFKKIVIADGVADGVGLVYGMTSVQPTALDIIIATYLFYFQIYCDFSGYSDVARGIAKLMGFELINNFNLPMFSINAADLWMRWHISLSNWLRDYIYLPLIVKGLYRGEWYMQSVTMLTFFLSGVWHGAAWNFILWGFYQGTLACGRRFIQVTLSKFTKPKRKIKKSAHPKRELFILIAKILFFFNLLTYGRLLFRAESSEQIVNFTSILFFDFTFHTSVNFSIPEATLLGILILVVLESYQFFSKSSPHFYRSWPIPIRAFFYATLLFLLTAGMSNVTQEFIYFAF